MGDKGGGGLNWKAVVKMAQQQSLVHFNHVNVPLLEILNTFFIRDKSS